MRAATLALAAFAALGGCGVIYTSPSVYEAAGGAGELDVRVVSMTHESVAEANLTPYVPPRLPAAFAPDAASRAVGSVRLPSPGALPAPSSDPDPRPGFIPENLPPQGTPQPYRIGVGDVLLLSADPASASLEQLPGLISAQSKRQGFVVQDDGAIAVPDVGRVRVAGLTLGEAEAVIFDTLVEKRLDPTFSLEVSEFNSQRVSVGGLVGQPTLVPISLRPLYLEEAINIAGGIQVADTETGLIRLFRGGEVYQIPLNRFINDPRTKTILLTDGDSVYVGSAYEEDGARVFFQEQLSLRQFQLQAATAILSAQVQAEANALGRLNYEREVWEQRLELGAVERAYAYVAGEVRQTGRVGLPFERTATLADVLFSDTVKGLTINFADYEEIYVIRSSERPEEFGGVTAFHLDASNAANLALAARFQMRPNDVVWVSEQPVTTWNRVITQLTPQLLSSAAQLGSI